MNSYDDIINAFDDIIRDKSRYYFTQLQVDRFANRALREIGERTLMIDEHEDIDTVAGTLEYSISVDGYDVFRVEYDGEILFPISRDALRFADRDWASRSGLPKYYYLDEIYDEQEYLTVGVFEAPSTDLTDGLKVWYHAYPRTLVGITSLNRTVRPEIPAWAVGAVLFYMLKLAYTAETKIQSLESAAIFSLMYEDILERLIARSRDRQPKRWVAGGPSSPSLRVLNRLPQRIS